MAEDLKSEAQEAIAKAKELACDSHDRMVGAYDAWERAAAELARVRSETRTDETRARQHFDEIMRRTVRRDDVDAIVQKSSEADSAFQTWDDAKAAAKELQGIARGALERAREALREAVHGAKQLRLFDGPVNEAVADAMAKRGAKDAATDALNKKGRKKAQPEAPKAKPPVRRKKPANDNAEAT